MLNVIQKIKGDYNFDWYAISLFIIVSFSFKSLYKYLIPFIVVLTLIQFYRFLINRLSKENFFTVYFYLLIYSTVFYKSVQTIILISLLFFLIGLFVKKKPQKLLKFIKAEVFILGFFGLILINSAIFEPRFKGVEKYLYLLLFPIAFILIKKLSLGINKIKSIRVFIASILVASLLLVITNLFESTISLKTNTYFSKYLDLTHVYYGMFVGLAASFLLILYKEGTNFTNTKFDVIIMVFFVSILIHIGARISLLALLIVFILILFTKIPLPLLQRVLLLLILGSGFVTLTYKTIPRLRDDIAHVQKVFLSVKNNDEEDLIQNSWRNMYQRFLVTTYTVDKIKEKPFAGIGMQNVKKTISDKIKNDGYLYFKPLNTHNQYLQIWVGMGLFGLLYFLWMLFTFYKLQSYSLYFLSFFLIIMLTESILVRIKGIAVFFIFCLILSFKESKS